MRLALNEKLLTRLFFKTQLTTSRGIRAGARTICGNLSGFIQVAVYDLKPLSFHAGSVPLIKGDLACKKA